MSVTVSRPVLPLCCRDQLLSWSSVSASPLSFSYPSEGERDGREEGGERGGERGGDGREERRAREGRGGERSEEEVGVGRGSRVVVGWDKLKMAF